VVGVLSAALPWAVAPVLADVLVFVIAILFVKFRPGGLFREGEYERSEDKERMLLSHDQPTAVST